MKKCPVCSREYRDVVSLCPFDGANLTPAGAEEKRISPATLPTERFTLPDEIVPVPLDPPATVPDEAFDPETTLIRATPHEPLTPLPENPETRANAANEMSLPHNRVSGEIDPEPAIRPASRVPPVIPPMGPGRVSAPVREFNPWRIATFALAGLIVTFGLIWAFTSKSTPNSNTDPLAVDPNGMNVNTAPPVTGMGENGLPPLGANMNSGNFNMPPPMPGAGMGPLGGPTAPFPSGPPPSLRNMNAGFPPPTVNSNTVNANTPNFNSGGIVTIPTPKPGATPKPVTIPTPNSSATPKPIATPGPTMPKPPTPVPTVPKPPANTPRAAPTPRETVPEPLF